MKMHHLVLATTLAFAAAPALAGDQLIDLSSGQASFIGSDPLLDSGDDMLSFFGLAAGTYDLTLSLSAQNISGFSGDLNGASINVFNDSIFSFGSLIVSEDAPFTLTLFGTASASSLYSGEINARPVPEPETYAMLLAGLGLVGYAVRRRRS